MKRLVLCVLLMFVPTLAFCSQPDQATAPASAKGDSNDSIRDNLESVLQGDPILSGADVQTRVDDQSITLTGTVESYAQHQRVLQLVEPYTQMRKVIDKIKTVNSQTKYATHWVPSRSA